MAALKPIALSLALLSLTTMGLAEPAMSVDKTIHDSTWKQDDASLNHALYHNSFAGHVTHYYLKGKSGLWIGAFGQVVGALNSHYLLMPGRRTMVSSTGYYPPARHLTIGIPHADVMIGYDSNNVGFFVDYGYALNPAYLTTTTIGTVSSFNVNEAYMTYKLSPQFAIKAGHFISSFGDFDPTNPMTSLVGEINKYDFGTRLAVTDTNKFAVNGFEGVFSANGFYGAVAGVAQLGASSANAHGIINNAKFNTLILSGGYNLHFDQNTLGMNAAYTNVDWVGNSAWTGGVHLMSSHWRSGVKMYHSNAKLGNGKRLWVASGHVDYLFAKHLSIGGYGDYTFNMNKAPNAEIFPYHWNLGAKAGYALTKAVTLDLYVQHQTVLPSAADLGIKDNTSGVLALTFKL